MYTVDLTGDIGDTLADHYPNKKARSLPRSLEQTAALSVGQVTHVSDTYQENGGSNEVTATQGGLDDAISPELSPEQASK